MRLKPILFFAIVGSLATYVVVHQIRQGDGGIIRIGQMAPDFSTKGPDGQQIRLADHRGKLVFLNFWASWCEPCEREMPDLEKLTNTMKNRKFQMIAVSVDANPDNAIKFYKDHKLTLPWFADPGRIVADKYKVSVYPETFLIDGNGHIIKHYPGAVNSQIISQIEDIVREQEAADRASR